MTSTAKVVETFRQLARLPSPTGVFGRTTAHGFEIETLWTQRDLEKKETTKLVKNHLLLNTPADEDDKDIEDLPSCYRKLVSIGRPIDVSTEIWRVYADSGDKYAVLRKGGAVAEKEGGKEEKQWVEVWSRHARLVTVDVAKQEKHGLIYGDDHVFGSLQVCGTANFGTIMFSFPFFRFPLVSFYPLEHDKNLRSQFLSLSLSPSLHPQFSPCENYLLYIAEKKKPKHETFFDPFGKSSAPPLPNGAASTATTTATEPIKGEKYSYVEEWGEQLVGKSRPVLCILDVTEGVVHVLDDEVEAGSPRIPTSISPGQAVWTPASASSLGIVFVGFDHAEERLGIIYCPMRPSRLYFIEVKVGAA